LLLTLVRSTSARSQGAAENPVSFLINSVFELYGQRMYVEVTELSYDLRNALCVSSVLMCLNSVYKTPFLVMTKCCGASFFYKFL
jgi:hypothetical protein